MFSKWDRCHLFDVPPTLSDTCSNPKLCCHPSVSSLQCINFSPPKFPKHFGFVLLRSAFHCPAPLNQICPWPLLLPLVLSLSAELCWWYWVLGRVHSGSAGICSQGWTAASHWASLRQPESRCWIYLQPTCQLMLFVGVRRVGIASLAFALPRCPREI